MDIEEELKKMVISKSKITITDNNEEVIDDDIASLIISIGESLDYEICKALANVYNAYYDHISSNGCYPIEEDGFAYGCEEIIDLMTEKLVEYWL
jgi:hypothetical protein